MIELKLALWSLLLLGISMSAVAVAVSSAQTNNIEQAIGRAYSELRDASSAGANVTALSYRFNVALDLLQKARESETIGDLNNASKLKSEAENSLIVVIQDAQKLRDFAIAEHERELRLQILIIPAEAFIVAVAVVSVVRVRRTVKSKQFSELKIEAKSK